MQFTVLVYGQPGPTRTKQSDCCCIEFFLEVLEAAEVTFDCFSQFASGFFVVASEETEPGNGWLYSGWLSKLAKNPAMNGAELGKEICDSFKQGCKQAGPDAEITLSVTDLSKTPAVIEAPYYIL